MLESLSQKPFHASAAASTRLLLLILFSILFPASVSAIPIGEYQQNLKNAIIALETLAEIDEDESTSDYESRFNQTLGGIRLALPRNQTVESRGDVCNVDNAWLHKALDELTEEVDRPEKLQQIIEPLRAIEARVAENQEAGRAAETKDQAKSKLESILARPEYATGARGPNALTRLLQDLLQWILKLFPKRTPASHGSAKWINLIAQIGVIVAGLLVLLFIIKILLSRFKRTGKVKTRKKREPRIVLGERLEPEQTATDLLSEAEALARRGELRAAIRKGYIALLVELGDRKMISLAQHKTNRDYLNALRNVPQLHSELRGLTDSFERHWYGFVQATENDWQQFRNGYLAALQTETN